MVGGVERAGKHGVILTVKGVGEGAIFFYPEPFSVGVASVGSVDIDSSLFLFRAWNQAWAADSFASSDLLWRSAKC